MQNCSGRQESESSWGLPCCSIDKPIRKSVTIKPHLPIFDFKQYYLNLSLCMCRQLYYNQTQPQPNMLVSNTGKLQNLSKISWFTWFYGWFLCYVVWRHVTNEKLLNFDGLSRQETLEQHFAPHELFQDCGHSYEAFTYLFGRNIFIRLLSANKNSLVDLLTWANMEDFGLIRDYSSYCLFFWKLVRN